MRAVRRVGREPAAVVRGRGGDAIGVGPRRGERHQAAHAVAGRADAARLHVGLRREVVEERARVRHDVGRRRVREELLHQDLALLGIGEDRVRIHRLVRTGAVEEIRQQHEVAVRREALAELEHRRANAEAVHEDEDRGPGAPAAGDTRSSGRCRRGS